MAGKDHVFAKSRQGSDGRDDPWLCVANPSSGGARGSRMTGAVAAFRRAISRIRRLPRTTRLAFVAAIGLPLAWVTYEIVYLVNPFSPRATTSWIVAFAIGIARQHFLHGTISFHDRKVLYARSLFRAYVTSIVLGIVSTLANWGLTERLGMHHQLAWAICILGVGAADYLTMKLYVFRAR